MKIFKKFFKKLFKKKKNWKFWGVLGAVCLPACLHAASSSTLPPTCLPGWLRAQNTFPLHPPFATLPPWFLASPTNFPDFQNFANRLFSSYPSGGRLLKIPPKVLSLGLGMAWALRGSWLNRVPKRFPSKSPHAPKFAKCFRTQRIHIFPMYCEGAGLAPAGPRVPFYNNKKRHNHPYS